MDNERPSGSLEPNSSPISSPNNSPSHSPSAFFESGGSSHSPPYSRFNYSQNSAFRPNGTSSLPPSTGSTLPASNSTVGGTSGTIPPFLKKLMEMVEDVNTNDLISWHHETEGVIVIHDQAALTSRLLHKYFKHENFCSFVRQLNSYGFRKRDTEKWEFKHDFLKRGDPSSLVKISRRKSQKTPYSGNEKGGHIDKKSSGISPPSGYHDPSPSHPTYPSKEIGNGHSNGHNTSGFLPLPLGLSNDETSNPNNCQAHGECCKIYRTNSNGNTNTNSHSNPNSNPNSTTSSPGGGNEVVDRLVTMVDTLNQDNARLRGEIERLNSVVNWCCSQIKDIQQFISQPQFNHQLQQFQQLQIQQQQHHQQQQQQFHQHQQPHPQASAPEHHGSNMPQFHPHSQGMVQQGHGHGSVMNAPPPSHPHIDTPPHLQRFQVQQPTTSYGPPEHSYYLPMNGGSSSNNNNLQGLTNGINHHSSMPEYDRNQSNGGFPSENSLPDVKDLSLRDNSAAQGTAFFHQVPTNHHSNTHHSATPHPAHLHPDQPGIFSIPFRAHDSHDNAEPSADLRGPHSQQQYHQQPQQHDDHHPSHSAPHQQSSHHSYQYYPAPTNYSHPQQLPSTSISVNSTTSGEVYLPTSSSASGAIMFADLSAHTFNANSHALQTPL